MKTQIISLEGVVFDGDLKLLNIKTKSGEITILPQHRPMMTVLAAGQAYGLDEKDERHEWNFQSGVAEVTEDNRLRVLFS